MLRLDTSRVYSNPFKSHVTLLAPVVSKRSLYMYHVQRIWSSRAVATLRLREPTSEFWVIMVKVVPEVRIHSGADENYCCATYRLISYGRQLIDVFKLIDHNILVVGYPEVSTDMRFCEELYLSEAKPRLFQEAADVSAPFILSSGQPVTSKMARSSNPGHP